jgi:hypothetical protein
VERPLKRGYSSERVCELSPAPLISGNEGIMQEIRLLPDTATVRCDLEGVFNKLVEDEGLRKALEKKKSVDPLQYLEQFFSLKSVENLKKTVSKIRSTLKCKPKSHTLDSSHITPGDPLPVQELLSHLQRIEKAPEIASGEEVAMYDSIAKFFTTYRETEKQISEKGTTMYNFIEMTYESKPKKCCLRKLLVQRHWNITSSLEDEQSYKKREKTLENWLGVGRAVQQLIKVCGPGILVFIPYRTKSKWVKYQFT